MVTVLYECSLVSRCEIIYDILTIQPPPFVYHVVVMNLWLPNQKAWNSELVISLFSPQVANVILTTHIMTTHAGDCTSKSEYKHLFNNLALPTNQQPKLVPQHIIYHLNQVW
jgi:hypothetical protein